ncbi:MAG: helix-turn-helix domain-containing protein [Candidatus Binatia bacterium]
MLCEDCQMELVERKATAKAPYHYDVSGLSNVYLAGIVVYRCPRCKEEAPAIPRIEELHRAIARALIHKPGVLNGEEIRFLRKHAGFPAQKFAALLGIRPEHLSRVENGRTASLGTPTDRLARAIATTANDGEDAREMLLKMADILGRKGQKAGHKPLFTLEQNHWRATPEKEAA